MQIGQVAERTGLTAKTIRYYESIGLVTPRRESNGYRIYDAEQIRQLEFVQRARALGFSIAECRSMMVGSENGVVVSEETKAILRQRLNDIEVKLNELTALRETLTDIARSYRNDLEAINTQQPNAGQWQSVFGDNSNKPASR